MMIAVLKIALYDGECARRRSVGGASPSGGMVLGSDSVDMVWCDWCYSKGAWLLLGFWSLGF